MNVFASTQVSSVLTDWLVDPQTAVDDCLQFEIERAGPQCELPLVLINIWTTESTAFG